MNIMVYGNNLEVSEALKLYAVKKLGKAAKLLGAEESDMRITLSVLGHKPLHEVEILVQTAGRSIRVEQGSDNMYASIDQAAEKLFVKARRWKEKRQRRIQSGGLHLLMLEHEQEAHGDDEMALSEASWEV